MVTQLHVSSAHPVLALWRVRHTEPRFWFTQSSTEQTGAAQSLKEHSITLITVLVTEPMLQHSPETGACVASACVERGIWVSCVSRGPWVSCGSWLEPCRLRSWISCTRIARNMHLHLARKLPVLLPAPAWHAPLRYCRGRSTIQP